MHKILLVLRDIQMWMLLIRFTFRSGGVFLAKFSTVVCLSWCQTYLWVARPTYEWGCKLMRSGKILCLLLLLMFAILYT